MVFKESGIGNGIDFSKFKACGIDFIVFKANGIKNNWFYCI